MTRGIILGGGHGTRLKPLTDHTPKSLIEICGVPILEYIVTYMQHAGVSEISCISDMQKPVRPWLEEHKPYIRVVDQEEPVGTGQAVHLALQDLNPKEGRGLMVMLGDIVPTSLLLADIIRGNPRSSMLGVYESDTPSEGAVVDVTPYGYFRGVEEKPENPVTNQILSGVFYFADSERFFRVQQKLLDTETTLKNEYDIVGTIDLMHQYGESFEVIRNNVFDCGTFERIRRAEEYFAKNNVDG